VLIANHFSLLDQKPDFSSYTIVPVPLSKQRQRWRGFNQAKELADQLAVILDLECDSKCLIRTKNTATQVGLPSNKRALNIAGAFACPTRKDVAGKKILLIDDIITTGATMEECAKTLLKNGAAEIVALAVAHAEVSDV
jgi:ComF family protein